MSEKVTKSNEFLAPKLTKLSVLVPTLSLSIQQFRHGLRIPFSLYEMGGPIAHKSTGMGGAAVRLIALGSGPDRMPVELVGYGGEPKGSRDLQRSLRWGVQGGEKDHPQLCLSGKTKEQS